MADSYTGGLADLTTNPIDAYPYRDFIAFVQDVAANVQVINVAGEVLVPNPGIQAALRYADPQGEDSATLLLRLDVIQTPGQWPQMLTWVPCKYSATLIKQSYREVQITNPDLAELTIEVAQM